MTLLKYALLFNLVTLIPQPAQAEGLRSQAAKKVYCAAVVDEALASEVETGVLPLISSRQCRNEGQFNVVTLETNRLAVAFRSNDLVCEGYLNKDNDEWYADLDNCRVEASNTVMNSEPGDRNVIRLSGRQVRRISASIRTNIDSIDTVPATGNDGYYDSPDQVWAKIVSNEDSNVVVGYIVLYAFPYTEDPEHHIWIFRFSAFGGLVDFVQLDSIDSEEYSKDRLRDYFNWQN